MHYTLGHLCGLKKKVAYLNTNRQTFDTFVATENGGSDIRKSNDRKVSANI